VAEGLVDAKSMATYLSLLMPMLPHEGVSREEAERFPALADPLFTGALSGSPLKTPTR